MDLLAASITVHLCNDVSQLTSYWGCGNVVPIVVVLTVGIYLRNWVNAPETEATDSTAVPLSKMTASALVLKFSIRYLSVSAVLLMILFDRDWTNADWPLMMIGFPFMLVFVLGEFAFGPIGPVGSGVRLSLFVLLWLGDAYLWGQATAYLVRRARGLQDRGEKVNSQ